MNGKFPDSPLVEVLRLLDGVFHDQNARYAVIGGLAVARNGAPRTTHDIDILTSREEWEKVRPVLEALSFSTTADSALELQTGIPVDVLFTGDDWDMVFPLPRPEDVAEYDQELKASFIRLRELVELKTAVYLAKKAEDGPELAAKDLSDVIELLKANRERFLQADIDALHPGVMVEVERLWRIVQKKFR